MAPTNRPPLSPQDEYLRQSRELAAKRLAEQQAAMNEAKALGLQAAQDLQKIVQAQKMAPTLPVGFALPPRPVMGESTDPRQQQMRPPVQTQVPQVQPQQEVWTPEQQAEEDAIREAALREAELSMQESAVESAPPPPPPQARSTSSIKSQKIKQVNKIEAVHPILKQLRMDLGLDHQKTIDLTIADHLWSFYPLTPELTTLALRIAEISSTADTERILIQQYAAVCCSIVAIDNTPLWQVFGLTPEKDDDVSFPLMPKGRIRQRAALALLQELMTNSKLGVMASLLEAYNAEVDPTGSVKGYTAYKNEKYFKYMCPIDGCDFSVIRSKRFDTNNRELSYHCELHGTEMFIEDPEGISDVRGGLNPLG